MLYKEISYDMLPNDLGALVHHVQNFSGRNIEISQRNKFAYSGIYLFFRKVLESFRAKFFYAEAGQGRTEDDGSFHALKAYLSTGSHISHKSTGKRISSTRRVKYFFQRKTGSGE